MDLLNDKMYSFLKEHEKLGNNIGYLTLSGSKAYGTSVPTSDTDIRGFYFDNPINLLSLKGDKKDEVEDLATDTTIYSLRKFLNLALNCNPNVIEMLGTRDEDVLVQSEVSAWLRENVEYFLSKKAYVTFVGYATAQLRRLENALARDSYPQAEKEEHILKSLEAEMLQARELFDDNKFILYTDVSQEEKFDKEIFVDCDLKHIPLRKYLQINSQFTNMVRNYGKLNKRNHKKDEVHLRKHAMHLIRLYLMGLDIIKNHKVVTYRPENSLLMNIRNGVTSFEEVFDLQKRLHAQLEQEFKNCTLPDNPNYEAINDFYCKTLINQIKR